MNTTASTPLDAAIEAGEIAATNWMVNEGQLSSEAAALMLKAIRKQFAAHGPIDSIVRAAICAAAGILIAAGREEAARRLGILEGSHIWLLMTADRDTP